MVLVLAGKGAAETAEVSGAGMIAGEQVLVVCGNLLVGGGVLADDFGAVTLEPGQGADAVIDILGDGQRSGGLAGAQALGQIGVA